MQNRIFIQAFQDELQKLASIADREEDRRRNRDVVRNMRGGEFAGRHALGLGLGGAIGGGLQGVVAGAGAGGLGAVLENTARTAMDPEDVPREFVRHLKGKGIARGALGGALALGTLGALATGGTAAAYGAASGPVGRGILRSRFGRRKDELRDQITKDMGGVHTNQESRIRRREVIRRMRGKETAGRSALVGSVPGAFIGSALGAAAGMHRGGVGGMLAGYGAGGLGGAAAGAGIGALGATARRAYLRSRFSRRPDELYLDAKKK